MQSSHRALFALLCLVIAPAATAQDQVWIRQIGTSTQDGAAACAPDGSGGVYMTGTTNDSLGGPHAGSTDVWVGRYDGAGNRIWLRQLGTSSQDEAFGAAPDGSGGVYVLGTTSGPPGPSSGSYGSWLARYDGAGNRLWVRVLAGIAPHGARGVAPDGAGGVFLSGGTGGSVGGPSAGGVDAWLARYDGAGNRLWIRQLGTSSQDDARTAAFDGAGGVFVTGATSGSLGGPNAGNSDAWVARYDGGGTQLWIRQLASSGDDYPLAAAPDGAGGVYSTGLVAQGPSFDHDVWIARYDSAGNQLWLRELASSDGEQPLAAAPDGSGGVYVSGVAWGSLGGPSAGSIDAWLARYDGTGNQLWIRQFGTSDADSAGGAAPDGAGGVYVSGGTQGSLGGPNAGASDAWLARYDGDLGARTCSPAIVNSTGQPAVLTAIGSGAVVDDDVTLFATQLPAGQFGYFLAGQTQGSFNPPNSQGILCLSGNIGRYNQVANIIQGPTGSIQLDLTAIPVNPPQAVQAGETWNFQCWFRDNDPGPTSNFTDAVSVTFF